MTKLPRKLPTAQEFATLERAARLEVLRRASARQKLRLLVDAVDGEALLALLPPQDLYLLARELGSDQIPELLTMAMPEQWTAFFDFACWEGDRFSRLEARKWLAILLRGEEAWMVGTLLELDFELLVLILQREVQVLSGPEEMDDEAAMAESRRRERGYVLDYRDDDGAKLFGALIDALFRNAPDFCRYLLEAVRAEGESLLQETVYRQRTDRLLDQGLPEPHAAQIVYAWLDPETFVAGREQKLALGGSASGVVPGAALQLARPGGVLAEALAAGIDDNTSWELACLVNKALMAQQVDLGELDQVRAIVEQVYLTLNLALEYLTDNKVDAACRCLREEYAEKLFRLGFSLTLRLQRRARMVQESSIGVYLDPGERALLDPLLQRRPLFPEVVARPGRGGARPFAGWHEVRLVEERLVRLEIQQRLFEEHFPFSLPAPEEWLLEGCHPEDGSELVLATIFLTALANRLLGRPFAPQPLSVGDLAAVHAQVSREGRLNPELRTQTLAWLDSLEVGGGVFGDRCLALLEEEFCRIAAGDLDPRFVGGLITRAGVVPI